MPSAAKPARAPALQVAIVSTNAETLDGLQQYLADAGVRCTTTRTIRGLVVNPPLAASAAVIFPDDFPDLDLLEALRELRRQRPNLLVVIVTREPKRYRPPSGADRSPSPVVLPRPSFGWEILDAIRAHAERGGAP